MIECLKLLGKLQMTEPLVINRIKAAQTTSSVRHIPPCSVLSRPLPILLKYPIQYKVVQLSFIIPQFKSQSLYAIHKAKII